MKTVLIVLIVCLQVENSYSQNYIPFPEDSAQWSIWEHGLDSITQQPYISSFQLKMYGDTIINGISYNKIYKSLDISYPSSSDSLHCFIRQDTAQRKVFVRYPFYLYNDSSEILLNDFSLQVGDTFNVKLISNGTYHPAVIAYITDSVQTNTGYTREFDLYFVTPWVWGPACDAGCQWLEGIGNFCNLLYIEMPDSFCWNHWMNTQCFWHNGVYVTGGTFCDYSTGIKEQTEIKLQAVQPNPVTAISIFPYKERFKEVLIFDIAGKLLRSLKTNADEQFEINAEYFSNGYYFLKAISGDGKFRMTSFVVAK